MNTQFGSAKKTFENHSEEICRMTD